VTSRDTVGGRAVAVSRRRCVSKRADGVIGRDKTMIRADTVAGISHRFRILGGFAAIALSDRGGRVTVA
jgi:hypothetical protein